MGYTLLRNSPPVGCSGVLHSEEFLALSLLLLGSLSLIMSYWRQKRAITPRRRRGWYSNSGCPLNTNQGTAGGFCCFESDNDKKKLRVKLSGPGSVNRFELTCPHDKHHHDDNELPCPQLGGLAHFLHCHFV